MLVPRATFHRALLFDAGYPRGRRASVRARGLMLVMRVYACYCTFYYPRPATLPLLLSSPEWGLSDAGYPRERLDLHGHHVPASIPC